MEIENKKRKARPGWVAWGICISLICSVLFTATYGFFENRAKNQIQNPIECESHIGWIYQNSYLLYRDLYNKMNHTDLDFKEIYLPPVEGKEWIWNTELKNNIIDNSSEDVTTDSELYESLEYNEVDELLNYQMYVEQYFIGLEENFSDLNATYDYIIEDLDSGTYLTNLPSNNIKMSEQYFYLQFLFDENGNVTIGSEILGDHPTFIRKNANAVIRAYSLHEIFQNPAVSEYHSEYFQVHMPKNCRVTFCINNALWSEIQKGDIFYMNHQDDVNFYGYYYSEWENFANAGIAELFCLMICSIALTAIFLPLSVIHKVNNRSKICKLPLEMVATAVYILSVLVVLIIELAQKVSNDVLATEFLSSIKIGIPLSIARMLMYLVNILLITAYFFCVWFLGICVREIREIGFRKYIRQRWIFYRIFPYLKRKSKEVYDSVAHFDITKNANKMILKIVLVNAVIVFVIGSLWVGGFAIAVVYSILLYMILRKYISDLQKKYSILLCALNKIAEGDLNVEITEDLGMFEPFKPNVIRIQSGFRKAVDEEVKSQKMKTELITNVSHDLKTPLTAIITYVNLLKEENTTDEQRKEYLSTLERKSLRLKVLIEDLFEVSKANSQNITLNLMEVDIINLIKQVSFEMADKMDTAQLDVRMNLPNQKVILSLDSQKTYRIFENLFGNIAKYAMNGTRVYVDAILHEETIEIVLKNITAEEISVNAEDLTERFVRGDKSRNTEGSGLGLAIAKSFCELQNGRLNIQVDGDLFKVTTIWKLT